MPALTGETGMTKASNLAYVRSSTVMSRAGAVSSAERQLTNYRPTHFATDIQHTWRVCSGVPFGFGGVQAELG